MKGGDIESGETEQNPWFLNGIEESDIILGKEVGLIEDPKDIEPFEEMIEREEEYLEDLNDFLDEMERLDPNYYVKAECIDTKEFFENIGVRIVKKFDNWALGSIEGNKCVYVPNTQMNKITTGAIYNMTLIYTQGQKNIWRAIFVFPKIEPVEVGGVINLADTINNHVSEYIGMKSFHIPKVDIGKTVGKNGWIIDKIVKDYLYNNADIGDLLMEDDDDIKNASNVPQFNFIDKGEYTEINMWYNTFIDKLNECEYISFIPEIELLQKMYV
jgi:hypothetical protein